MTNGEIIAQKILQFYKDKIQVQIAKVIDAKDKELSGLRAALGKYGKHLDQCGIMRMVCPKKHDFGVKCMCGLDDLLAPSPAEEQKS